MARIVIAWEFGGGLGHILYDLPLASKLQQRGHEVVCIMKHVIDAEKIMGRYDIKVLQAPVWQLKIKQLENTFSYAETLFNQGYLAEGGLLSMVKAWRNLFDYVKPDLLIADHAPTALVAARGRSMKVMLYGTGFFAPPMQNPIPSIIPWVKPPDGLIAYSEKKAVSTINTVLKELQAPQLNCLSDLFKVDENLLCTFSELDHYQNREQEKFWGPVLSQQEGEKPHWPGQPDAKKVFCYLKPNYPHFQEVMSALERIDAVCIIFAPKLAKNLKEKFHSTNIVFYDNPVDMTQVCRECDLVVCHAGHGTMASALLQGKPLLLMPEDNQLEQVLIARKVVRQKLGLIVFTRQENRNIRTKLIKLLSDTEYSVQARKFAEKYNGFDPKKQLDEIADRCEEVLQAI